MATLSLKELKEENSDKTKETENDVIEDNKEDFQDDYVEVDEGLNEVTDKDSENEEGSENKSETETWMLTDEATSEENKGFVPNPEAAKQRRKYKALREENKEKDDEIEQLKARLAQVESGNQAPAPQSVEVKVPELPEDIYDEDAMRKYHSDMIEYNQSIVTNVESKRIEESEKQKQQQQLNQQLEALDKSFDSHLEEADELVNSGKITEEAFTKAHMNVYRSLDAVSNGNGKNLTKQLISKLGKGSSKVIYMLGVNNSKMSTLQNKLSEDPSGIQAAIYLGQLQSEISLPKKHKSNAPKPQAQIKGDTTSSGSQADKLAKKYRKMTDVQERISFKRKARMDGIDVSNW